MEIECNSKKSDPATLFKFQVQNSVTESQKMRVFNNEPLCSKDVSVIPGIGEAGKAKLAQANCRFAYEIVGFYLINGKSQQELTKFLAPYIEKRFLNCAVLAVADHVGNFLESPQSIVERCNRCGYASSLNS